MGKYALRRLLISIPAILGAALFIFILMRVVPGDVAALIVIGGTEGESQAVQEATELVRQQLGLDKPVHVQFFSWMWDLLRWDLGQSIWTRQEVTELIARRFPLTIQLALMALFISFLVSIPVGVLSAVKQDSVLDYLPRFLSILGLAAPSFWLAILVITYLAAWFGWIPALTYTPPWVNPARNVSQLIFPALVLGVSSAAIQVRITRTQMLEVLREDYVRTARAKGLREGTVIRRHAMRNALIPVVTIVGGQLGGLLSGALVVEVVFNIPGLGGAIVQAVRQRDYPVVQNLVLLVTVIHIMTNLGVDLFYGFLDPRISYAEY
ncbi:MAG: ABC transporter permease [Chloroflexi bacterium]|nr:ABC transporter permease [Chloroflexota bacterium]